MQIEGHILNKEDLSHVPYCFHNKNVKEQTNNSIIIQESVQKDPGFKVWAKKKNRTKIKDLYEGNTLSFQKFRDNYQIPAKYFYRFLQLQHFICSRLDKTLEKPKLSLLESLLTQGINRKHISLTYNLLIAQKAKFGPREMGERSWKAI